MKLLCQPISSSDWIPDRFCIISMEFLSLRRRRSSSWDVPQQRWARRNFCHSQASHVNMSLQLYISYPNKHSHFTTFHFVYYLTISQHLEFKDKIQNDSNEQITTTTECFVPWSNLKFTKVCSKTLLNSSTHQWFLSAIRSYMLHIPNSAEGNCFNRKRKPQNMSEKRHKINKFANYQHKIVRNSPALDHHVFVPSQNLWSAVFDVMHMIGTQICGQDPCWLLCELWKHCLDFI